MPSIDTIRYCSLGEGSKDLLQQPVVTAIAKKFKKTAAQVLLRWGVQKGMVVIPCSTQPSHMKENMDIFDWEMDQADIVSLDKLHCNKRYGWKGKDPETVP